jgi:UrcA family protein
MSRIFIVLAALAAAAASPAAASIPRDAGTRVVRYADLDLNAAPGRVRLEERIRAAVRAVCGFAVAGDLRADSQMQSCRAATMARVVRPPAAAAAVGATQ